MMERFFNGAHECIVLERKGESALILRPESSCCPYIVVMRHVPGETTWWQGSYYKSLAAALEDFNGR